MENILERKAFTVSVADEAHLVEADYVGLVSGNDVPDKLERSGFHVTRSEFVGAPVIDELPLVLECRLVSYDPNTHFMVGEIVNAGADEAILDDAGMIDPAKLKPLTFSPYGSKSGSDSGTQDKPHKKVAKSKNNPLESGDSSGFLVAGGGLEPPTSGL